MTKKPSTIKNLGPVSDAFYGRAGIKTAEQLRALGPDEAYFRALAAGGRPHFIGYYAMVMGLQGRPFNDCDQKEKDALKQRFEAIKARLSPEQLRSSGIDKALSEIGVVISKK